MSPIGKWFGFNRQEVFEEGLHSYERGGYELAAEAFETCLEDPSDLNFLRLARRYLSESYAQLGQTSLEAKGYEAAAGYFRLALRLFPDYPDLHLQLAKAIHGMGDRKETLREARRALELNPNFVEAMLFEGALLYECGQHERGLAQVRRAAELEPGVNSQRFDYAFALHEEGNPAGATNLLFSLASGRTSVAGLHARVAASFARDRMFEDAVDEYRKAISLAPAFADLRFRMATVLLEMGLADEAVAQLQRALELNPGYVEAAQLLQACHSGAGFPLGPKLI